VFTYHSGQAIGPGKSLGAPYQKNIVVFNPADRLGQLEITIESVVRDNFPKRVQAYVYVRDRHGNFVSGLAKRRRRRAPNDVWLIVQDTDSMGSRSANKALGFARASAVAKELKRLGVDSRQIQVLSAGENRLLYDPDYPDESKAAQNRRVEFQLSGR
jgi:hypothetical protein